MAELDCVPESNLGTAVSVAFGSIYGLILIGVSIYSFRFLMRFSDKFLNASCIRKLRLWFMDVYKRRRCYLPIITHLADMITDFAVVVQFGELAVGDAECGINMWYLFGLSIFVLLFYRTISSFLIYQTTKSCSRLIVQWLDFELFRTLYINYLCDKDEPCSPQRWITSLEAAFESTPQALIQTIFLVKTGSFNENPVVLASLVFSLWSIISKIISDDRVIAKSEAKYASFNAKRCKKLTCISWPFIWRYIWRIFDVSSRILIASLTWLIVGGAHLTIIVVVECLVILIISARYQRYEFLFGIVAMVVSKSTDLTKQITRGLIIYRSVTNVLLMVLMTLMLFVFYDNDCWRCSELPERHHYRETASQIFPLYIYCWFTCLMTPVLSWYLTKNVFTGTKSNARSIEVMIKTGDWNGIIEMQAYKGEYGVYDKANGKTLLMLAVEHNYGKLVNHLSSGNRVQLDEKTNDGENVLDFFKKSGENADGKASKLNKTFLGDLLVDVHKKHPEMVSNDGEENIACIACYLGDVDTFRQLQDKHDISNVWTSAEKADQPEIMYYLLQNSPTYHLVEAEADSPGLENVSLPPYTSEHNKLIKQMIDVRNPRSTDFFLDRFQSSVKVDSDIWFYAADHGDLKTIQAVRNHVKNVNTTNDDGQTVLHLVSMNSGTRGMKIVNYLQSVVDTSIRDKSLNRLARDYLKKLQIADSAEYKITVLGRNGSGKSALVIRFVADQFLDEYDPTIEDSYRKSVDIDRHKCLLDVLDTANQDEFGALRDQWMREGKASLVMFGIDNREQFEATTEYVRNISTTLGDDVGTHPVILVGNKSDLENERMVQREAVERVMREWRQQFRVNAQYMEVSAKQNINVDEVFNTAIRQYWLLNGYSSDAVTNVRK